MRKIPLITLLVFMFMPLLSSAAASDTLPAPPPGSVQIIFDYLSQRGSASNQFAVWIEDAQGALIQTLYATRYTAQGGYLQRPDSIPSWVEKSGLASMSQADVDAVTGATPRPGTLSYVWDLTDASGNPVPPGEYRAMVEGSLRWKNRVVYSGTFLVGGDPATAPAEAAFFFEGTADRPALTANSPESAMIGPVTVSYAPAEE